MIAFPKQIRSVIAKGLFRVVSGNQVHNPEAISWKENRPTDCFRVLAYLQDIVLFRTPRNDVLTPSPDTSHRFCTDRVFWPFVLGIASFQLFFHLEIAICPETFEVLGELNWLISR